MTIEWNNQTLLTDVTPEQHTQWKDAIIEYCTYNDIGASKMDLCEVIEIIINLSKGWER